MKKPNLIFGFRFSKVWLILLLGLKIFVNPESRILHSDFKDYGAQVINSTDSEIVFQFITKAPSIITDNQVFDLPGLNRLVAKIGDPDLPQTEVMIGIPQTGEVVLQVKPVSVKRFNQINIPPVPKQSWENTVFEKSAVYEQDRFYPGSLAFIKECGFWRDVRVCKILISPAQYNPVRKELNIYETLTVALRFTELPKSQPENISPVFDPIYEKVLLNGNIAKNWKWREESKDSFVNFFQRSDNWLKVKIETTGVYKITYNDLRQAGLSTAILSAINPKTFRLFNIGNWTSNVSYPDSMLEIPIYVYGEADNSFDRGDYFIFWGAGVSGWDSIRKNYKTNYFTRYNYYWLTYGGDNGKRITQVNSTTRPNPLRLTKAHSIIHFEEDKLCPARSGLLWLWYYLTKPASLNEASLEIPFILPNADSLIKLTLAVYQPASNLSANFNIYLNDRLVGSRQLRIANTSPYIVSLETLPLVNSDFNTLKIQLTGSTEMQLYVDYFEIEFQERLNLSRYNLEFFLPASSPGPDYEIIVKGVHRTPFIFDITDKFQPKWLTDFILNGDSLRFQVSSEGKRFYHLTDGAKLLKPLSIELRHPGKLKSDLQSADYYIVTPDALFDAARLLSNYRNNNIAGLTYGQAKVAKLQDIYDEYAFGIEEPGAIREFFRHKRPSYGLLLGDATYDYRNNLGFNDFPVMPAYEQGFDFDPDVYTQAALAQDVYYAQFDTGPPDMILGRVTCRTQAQVRQFYEKITEYEANPLGFWTARILLLADDEWKGVNEPDHGMIWLHIIDCDAIENIFKNRLEPVKIYLTEYPFAPGDEYAKPLARASFIQALNQGALILCYFGHGAGWQLAHEKVFYVEEDVVKVNNGRRNPFAFFGSCGVGRFEDTRFQAIAEELVRIPDGCIGTVGATKATFAGTNLVFANEMFGYFADTSHFEATIGQAFFAAWPRDPKYHLFGDPAVVLNLPSHHYPLSITPETLRLGELCVLNVPSDTLRGSYFLFAFGPKWLRTYSSFFYNQINTVNYILPGFELFRGSGTITTAGEISFIVPRGQNPNMRGEGYLEKLNSAKVYLGFFDGQTLRPLIKDSIPISYDTLPRTDTTGPLVRLYADGRPINNGSMVPAQFIFSGTIYDPSGILILPNTVTGCSLYFYEPVSGKPIGLSQYFIYCNNSYTQGQFIYPESIKLTENYDTLTLIAYDGQLNRTEQKIEVRKSPLGLLIENVLVYPNPVKTKTYFTFLLSKRALVRVSIYTINGRLVKRLPECFCSEGYNQIEWDGRDETKMLPANGVYLFQIKARVFEDSGQELSTSVTDKFLILR